MKLERDTKEKFVKQKPKQPDAIYEPNSESLRIVDVIVPEHWCTNVIKHNYATNAPI